MRAQGPPFNGNALDHTPARSQPIDEELLMTETKSAVEARRNRMTEDDFFVDDDDDNYEEKYLSFRLDNEDYGMNIADIIEIIGLQKITPIPEVPNYIKGVINLRGKIIPVLDVRLRFGLDLISYHDRTSIIVVNVNDVLVGMVVDEVSEVVDIAGADIDPAPNLTSKAGNQFIQGIGKVNDSVKILLDPQKILHQEELSKISDSI